MSLETEDEHRNFIEAKIIIQECHDDPTVFVVGTAPFGKLWFDHDKINQQYKILTDSWYEEYGDNETHHSKRPRIVSVLLDEKDAMFNHYRENIREAQEKKNTQSVDDTSKGSSNENVVIDTMPTSSEPKPKSVKKKKPCKKNKTDDVDNALPTTVLDTPSKKKRGRPKKEQPDMSSSPTEPNK